MKSKFSTFAKRAKLRTIVDKDEFNAVERTVYEAPDNCIITFNGVVIVIVIHYPARVVKNPLGGVTEDSEEVFMVSVEDSDGDDEYDIDPTGIWCLYKKVI